MSTINKDQYAGGAGLTSEDGLALDLRHVADDFTALQAAAAGPTVNGIVDGLVADAPTTPSTQASGTGATDWNVDIAAGNVIVDSVQKTHTAQADFDVYHGPCLLTNGQSIYAWLVEKNVTGTVTTAAVKGTAATTGSEVAPTDAAITVACGSKWVKLALLHLSRTADTVLVQTEDLRYREMQGARDLTDVTLTHLRGA